MMKATTYIIHPPGTAKLSAPPPPLLGWAAGLPALFNRNDDVAFIFIFSSRRVREGRNRRRRRRREIESFLSKSPGF